MWRGVVQVQKTQQSKPKIGKGQDRPAEAPALDPQRHPESTVPQSLPLITVAQSISGVKNAQSMAEPARESLLISYRTLQVKLLPLGLY